MMTGLAVLKIVLMPSRHRRVRRKNSGPRWSMIGVSMARRMRSGSGEGPGMCRKWRPAVREEFLAIGRSLIKASGFGGEIAAGRRVVPGAGCVGRHQGRIRDSVKPIRLPVGEQRITCMAVALAPGLERRLKAEIAGDVLFDPAPRGGYATHASHYQGIPGGVVVPRDMASAERALALARQEGVSVLPRGGGTSQCGQTVNDSLVVDCSKHLTRIIELDVPGRRCVVEPGVVLDDLNRALKAHDLWFPVDISTSSRATIGGMAANNSCGARSLRYGTMRDNVISLDAVLPDGAHAHFGPTAPDLSDVAEAGPLRPLARELLTIGAREAAEIEARFPKVQRRVGGYNLDALLPGRNELNLAHILVGSEGTLAFSTAVELKLRPVLGRRAVGACHFSRFYDAMDAARHIVTLGPIGVELVDRTML